MSKPILCLDFDGVLHSYTSGWQGVDIITDPAVPGASEFLKSALEHFEIHVFSTRSRYPHGILAMWAWCEQEFGTEIANQLKFPTHKPPAMITLDDRALTFTGSWPAVASLLSFKPWNK